MKILLGLKKVINQYIWRKAPILSSAPKKLLKENTQIIKEEVFQKALFLLENNKFMFIFYNGEIEKEESGISQYWEYDSKKEAEEAYDNF